MKIFRLLVGVLLIPACIGVTRTAISLLKMIQPESTRIIPLPGLALAGGFLLWQFLYYTLPRPVRTYVLAHELTHALWGAMMGARVSRMRISAQSGSVTVSKSNFLITLAPYFFPLYTAVVIVSYYVLSIFFDLEQYHVVWLGLVGFTWGFHFNFTITTLLQHQSDIQKHGYIFSYTVIYILNILGICLWIVMVSVVTFEEMISGLISEFTMISIVFRDQCQQIISRFRQ